MPWFSESWRRLRALGRRRQIDADLEEELRLHMELRAEQQVKTGAASDEALYAFPLQMPSRGQQVRRAGGVVIWGIAFALLVIVVRSTPLIAGMIRRSPRTLDFRTRTSLSLTAVVVLPLIVFVLFVRAYLANHPPPPLDDEQLVSALRALGHPRGERGADRLAGVRVRLQSYYAGLGVRVG